MPGGTGGDPARGPSGPVTTPGGASGGMPVGGALPTDGDRGAIAFGGGGILLQSGGSLIGPAAGPGATPSGSMSSGGSGRPGGWGAGDLGSVDGLRSLGLGTPPLPLGARLVVEVVATAGGVTLFMAFFTFGKRRRDGEPPASDDVLRSKAATLLAIPTTTLIPQIASAMAPAAAPSLPGGAMSPEELAMPRWRRPSLLQARKADPLRSAREQTSLTFEHGAVDPVEGHDRRLVRYRLVRLLDQPDELRGNEVGFLDEGDEVQVLTRAGTYCLVLCPDGGRGWIHQMTLGEIVEEQRAPMPIDEVRRSFGGPSPSRAGGGGALGGVAGGTGAFGPSGFAEAPSRADAGAADPGAVDEDVITAFLSARRAR